MMIIIISLAMLFLGAVQIYLSVKNTKEIKAKLFSTNVIASQEEEVKKQALNNFLIALSAKFKKIRVNLIGKNNELFAKHLAIIIVACGVVLYVNMEFLNFDKIIMLSVTILAGFYILYIQQVKKSRRDFERDFSEALNIINSAVRVGRPVMQGFEECGRVIDSDFGREFKRILMRLDIGDEPERVFMDSYSRYPYSEYFSFVITVLINMKGGGQVSEVMSRLTMLISASKTLERKKIAMTAEARMSVKVLVIIPVFFSFS